MTDKDAIVIVSRIRDREGMTEEREALSIALGALLSYHKLRERAYWEDWGEEYGLPRVKCSNCGNIICYKEAGAPKYCSNCGAEMISSNGGIVKSKSEIVPDYRDGWRLREGEAE